MMSHANICSDIEDKWQHAVSQMREASLQHSCPVYTYVSASACFHKALFKICVQAKVSLSQKANASFGIAS